MLSFPPTLSTAPPLTTHLFLGLQRVQAGHPLLLFNGGTRGGRPRGFRVAPRLRETFLFRRGRLLPPQPVR